MIRVRILYSERVYSKRMAFTMLELVMVILVLGIITALALPRIDRDIRHEASENILSAIRYTQHLALMDDVQGVRTGDNSWQRSFWRFGFQGCSDNGVFYFIASDTSREGNIDLGEEAIDPANGLLFNGLNTKPCEQDIQDRRSPNIFISKNYGIMAGNITYGGGCTPANQYISFDNMGRPHTGNRFSTIPDYSSVLTNDCILTFSFADTTIAPFSIRIEKESGYARIVGQPNS